MDTNTKKVQLAIIGGGPAGMSAAVAAHEAGIRDILILERDQRLGGILPQCIHNGFGLHRFGEELTGPEYARRYSELVRKHNIPYMLNTTVLSFTRDRKITAVNESEGLFTVEADAIILAMGCRERPRGALNIAGSRPAGIYSAGTAQKFVNMKGYLPGKSVVILGSGDIGLIMARRMTLEGAKVKAVCELMPYSGGLARNIEQCLNDFSIPLKFSHTVVKIHGEKRLTGVTIAAVDENRRPIEGSEEFIECDTLLLSVGLIPENELTRGADIELDSVTGGAIVDQNRETDAEGVFACGNVLHVHDLVDYVSEEAEIAGRAAADYIFGKRPEKIEIKLECDGKVRYTVPRVITEAKDVNVYFRVSNVFRDSYIVIKDGDKEIFRRKKIKFAPGEMETVKITEAMIKEASGSVLSLSIE
ncbi:MAG: FAD-dependent oxidoreductase [Clostridia bacterium]|nr:FAD-dependent oxidoreductase [Clostridia bacterium]